VVKNDRKKTRNILHRSAVLQILVFVFLSLFAIYDGISHKKKKNHN